MRLAICVTGALGSLLLAAEIAINVSLYYVSLGDSAEVLLLAVVSLALLLFFASTFASILLRRGTVSVKLFSFVAFAYLAVMCFVLFGKGMPSHELNLNPLLLVAQIQEYPFQATLNVLMFIPVALVASFASKHRLRLAIVLLALVLAIEAAQYVFMLGIADICDSILNYSGCLIGLAAGWLLEQRGAVPRVNGGVVTITNSQSNSAGMILSLLPPAFVLACGIALLPSLSVSFDEPCFEEYISVSEVLSELPDTPYKGSCQNSMTALVDGRAIGNEWLKSAGNNRFTIDGKVTGCVKFLDDEGNECSAFSVSIFESRKGVAIAHTVPLVVKNSLSVDGERVSPEGFYAMLDEGDGAVFVRVAFECKDGWLKAQKVEIDSGKHQDDAVDFAGMNWEEYDGSLVDRDGKYWMKVSSKEETRLEGVLDSISEWGDESEGPVERYAVVQVYDLIGNAPFFHSVCVWGDDFTDVRDGNAMPIMLKDGRLVHCE